MFIVRKPAPRMTGSYLSNRAQIPLFRRYVVPPQTEQNLGMRRCFITHSTTRDPIESINIGMVVDRVLVETGI